MLDNPIVWWVAWLIGTAIFIRVVTKRLYKSKYPRVTVDPDTGAIYIYLRPGWVQLTQELNQDPLVAVDYDPDGNALGVEIVN